MRVIHTENRGLSEARNVGVRAARAELVSFVDGDDVVAPHYLRLLYDAHEGVPGRMVEGGTRGLRRDEVGSVEWRPAVQGKSTLSRNDAIRAYLRWDAGFVAWGRLASRDLYLRIPFEPGVLYEDSYAFPSHLSAVDEVIQLDATLYGYIPREGSLSDPRVLTCVLSSVFEPLSVIHFLSHFPSREHGDSPPCRNPRRCIIGRADGRRHGGEP